MGKREKQESTVGAAQIPIGRFSTPPAADISIFPCSPGVCFSSRNAHHMSNMSLRVRNFGIAVLFVAATAFVMWSTRAQSTVPELSFEVVSIKSAGYHPGYDIHMRGDLYSALGVTAEFLIKYAYGITDDQLSGGPDWINSDKYAIDAKIPDSTVADWHKKYDAKKQAEEMRSMMRSLLADRFQLKISHQTKELPVFALVIAKGGPKISPSNDDGSKSGSDGHNEGYVEINHVTDEPISVLIDILSRQSEIAGRKIVDETGLTGKYTYTLKWTRERPPSDSDPADLPVSSAPLLWDALQDQLGLQLKSTKAAIDTVVIKHIEKPTPN